MADKMAIKETNVTTVREEDRKFIPSGGKNKNKTKTRVGKGNCSTPSNIRHAAK